MDGVRGVPPLAATNSWNLVIFLIPQQSAHTPVSRHHWIHPSSVPLYILTVLRTRWKISLDRIRSCPVCAGSTAETRIRNVVVSTELTEVCGSVIPVSSMYDIHTALRRESAYSLEGLALLLTFP